MTTEVAMLEARLTHAQVVRLRDRIEGALRVAEAALYRARESGAEEPACLHAAISNGSHAKISRPWTCVFSLPLKPALRGNEKQITIRGEHFASTV
jgi:hypothetical protein